MYFIFSRRLLIPYFLREKALGTSCVPCRRGNSVDGHLPCRWGNSLYILSWFRHITHFFTTCNDIPSLKIKRVVMNCTQPLIFHHLKQECVRSCDQKPYLHNETKGGICIKIEFNPQKNISLLQDGRRFFVYSSNMAAVTSCEHTRPWPSLPQFPLLNFYVQRGKPIIYAPLRSKTGEQSSAGGERNTDLIFFRFALQMVI